MRFGRVSNETLFGIREGMIGFLELALGEEVARDDLVRDLVDAELGSKPVLNRRNLGRALRNIKRRLVAFQDTSSLSYCPDKETRQGLRGFREEMRTCFPGFAEGISTLPLVQEAQNLGFPRYDRDFFSSLIRFSLLRNSPSSSEDTQLLIRKTLFLESKLVGTAIKFPDIKQGYRVVDGLVKLTELSSPQVLVCHSGTIKMLAAFQSGMARKREILAQFLTEFEVSSFGLPVSYKLPKKLEMLE